MNRYWHGSPVLIEDAIKPQVSSGNNECFCSPDFRYALFYSRNVHAIRPGQTSISRNYSIRLVNGVMIFEMRKDNDTCVSAEEILAAPGGYVYQVDPTGCKKGSSSQNEYELAFADPLPIIACFEITDFSKACEVHGVKIVNSLRA